MATFSKFRMLSAFGIGSLAVSGLIYYNYDNIFSNDYFGKLGHKNNVPLSSWDHNWDRRDANLIKSTKDSEDLKKAAKGKAIRHILLVRHGQYNLNGKNDQEKTLTILGRLQAEATGMRLAELALPYSTIVRSTLTRAQETSKLIESYLPTIPVVDDSLLIEGYPIPPDPPTGHRRAEKVIFQDGPRIEAAFRKYVHRADSSETKDTYTVIVCHANVIRYFICRALQFPPEAWLRMSLNHGSITWISILPSGRVILRCFGETGHMLPEWITSN